MRMIGTASLLALAASAGMLGGCTGGLGGGLGGGYDSRYASYDYDRPDPAYGGYYADRYYRGGRNYQERRLSANDRVYRGQNGRYYCRRDDGTTGLIVGGLIGGTAGAAIAPGGSGLLGALIGGGLGAAAGQAVDRGSNNDVRCR